jgi:hypothetical protein
MALSWLLVAWIGAGAPAALQSPISPVDASPVPTTVIAIPMLGTSPMPTAPSRVPDLLPGDSPLPVGVPSGNPIAPGTSVWSSPLPWVGVGVLVFGAAAWAALSIGRRADKGE